MASLGEPSPDLSPGDRRRRATMRDVAERAGVSVMTVSRVVNGQSTVHPELAARVIESAKALDFEPNRTARNLRSGGRPGTIGLIIEDLANGFYSRVARVVEEQARERGFLLMSASSQEDPSREREVALELVRRDVAGLIIVPTAGDHSYLASPIARGLSVVFVDRPAEGVTADTIVIDNYGGAKAGVSRLIRAGHRRIAVLGFTLETFTVAERVRGFRSAMAEAGLAVEESLVMLGNLSEEEAVRETGALMDLFDPPTAFFCVNNLMTMGVVEELHRRGIERDVVGFDEISFAKFLPMPVTYIGYDINDLARSASRMLFARIAGELSPIRTSTLPTTLSVAGGLRR